MCNVLISVYPCGHHVVTFTTACAVDTHAQLCNPCNVKFIINKHTFNISRGFQLPPQCPASNFGRRCLRVPEDPRVFAKGCLERNFPIEDVIAMAPVWIYDMYGNKVGTKQGPLAIDDYLFAYYGRKNKMAVGERLAMLECKTTMKAKLDPDGRIFSHTEINYDGHSGSSCVACLGGSSRMESSSESDGKAETHDIKLEEAVGPNELNCGSQLNGVIG